MAKCSVVSSDDSMARVENATSELESVEDKSTLYSFLKSVTTFSGDLSQLACPGFLLCGTSILEYCAHYGDYPILFNEIAYAENSLERIVAVTRWYISTLYGSFRSRCKDDFEKKPYNPILGEQFLCRLEDAQGNLLNVCCEQVSHHPPVSAFYLESPSAGVYVTGHCGQESKFKGTIIKVKQVGHLTVTILGCDEYFVITIPSMNIRSLLSGRPFLDLCGESYVYSSSGYVTTITYQQKPWFGGTYFGIEGHIKDASNQIQKTISGKWTEEFDIIDQKTGAMLSFNPESVTPAKPVLAPILEQSSIESQKLWYKVSQAIKVKNFSLASKEKSVIEERQRALFKERQKKKEDWIPQLFLYTDDPAIMKVRSSIKQPLVNMCGNSWVYKFPLKP